VKLNSHHMHTRAAEIRAADAGSAKLAAGSPSTCFAVPKKSTLSTAVAGALAFQFSPRFLIPLLSCTVPGLVFAGPQGGQIVAGSATISNPDANTTLITQNSARTAIDWQRFNIGSQEYVQFAQPDANSVALNRVIGGDPSQILGNLSANGQVFLVNPQGVYFGQSATVDVSGLVASVRDISTENFMSGNYIFSKTTGAPDDVGIVNDGVITAKDGGYVVLMGDYVHNNGIISARLGTVSLAAGNSITMDVKGNGLVSVAIEKETLSKLAGINNAGQIMADGGRVLMNAKVANDLIDTAINNDGLVVANSIAERNGVIFLTAAGGDVVNSGTLDASAESGSNVDGGGVLVYSDKNVTNAAGAKISATGDGSGDGGMVRVIAENFMDHQAGAQIDVTSDSGKGGFVEVSGHGSLALRGDIDLGSGGELLIDPLTLSISNGNTPPSQFNSDASVGKGFIESQLNSGVDITLVASTTILATGGSLGSGTPTFSIASTNPAGDLSIKIGTLAVGGGGSLAGNGVSYSCAGDGFCIGGGSVVFTPSASGAVNLATVTFNLAGGLNVAGGTTAGNVSLGLINAGGNVAITAGTDINLQGNVSAAGSSFKATAGNDVFVNDGIAAFGNPLNAKVTLNADNNVDINSAVYLANNDLLLVANNDGAGSGDVNIKGASGRVTSVTTQGNLSVRGNNFNVSGASVSGAVADVRTNVQGNNVDVLVTGNMVVKGGVFTQVTAIGDGTARIDASVTASNNMTINAASLTVSGGTAVASPSFGTTSLVVDANASLVAGGDLTVNLTGALNVSGGVANARTNGVSGSAGIPATANANASVNVAGLINVTANTATLKQGTTSAVANSGGVATASATSVIQGNNVTLNIAAAMSADSVSLSAVNDVNITAGTYLENISNSIAAGNNLSVSVAGNYTVNGIYSAANLMALSAGGSMDLNTVLGSTQTPLNSNVTLTAGDHLRLNNNLYLANQTLTLAADANVSGLGDVEIRGNGGTIRIVSTQGDLNVSGNNLNVTGASVASAVADSQVNVLANNINVTLSGGMNVAGGKYIPTYVVSTGAVQVSAAVKASNNIMINAASLTIAGGTAEARPSFATGTANVLAVDANASLEAGANVAVNLTGALNVSGGAASASSSTINSGSVTLTAVANANALLLSGGNLNITANAISVSKGTETQSPTFGGFATASASSKIQGNNVTLNVAASMNANSASVSALNDVNISAGTYLENINNSVIAGNNLSVSAGGNYAVNGFYSAANLLSLSAAGVLDLNAVLGSGQTPLNSDVTLSAGDHLRLNSDIYLTNQTLTLAADTNADGSGDVNITGSAGSPLNVSTQGDITVTGVGLNVADATVTAGTLKAEMGGTIEGLNANFNVGALYMSAAADINLTTSAINVGNGTVAGISGDAAALSILAEKGIPLPSTPNPNAKFVAGGTLNLGTISMSGNVPYLWMVADTTNIQGLNIPNATDVVVQYSPFTLSKSIGVEDAPDTSELVNYNNLQHFGILPGTTIIIGSSSQTGDINIGNLGKIDIGSKNIVFVTSARIATIDNVISSGVVAQLLAGQFNGQLILDEDDEEFVAPILTEVEVVSAPADEPVKEKDKRKHLIKDDEEKILMCEAS